MCPLIKRSSSGSVWPQAEQVWVGVDVHDVREYLARVIPNERLDFKTFSPEKPVGSVSWYFDISIVVILVQTKPY